MSTSTKQVALEVFAPVPTAGAVPTYSGKVKLGLDPLDHATQIKFGRRTRWAYPQRWDTAPMHHDMYELGGEVQSAGQALERGGSLPLLRVNTATGEVVRVHSAGDYLPAGQIQPQYPNGIGLMFDANPMFVSGGGTLCTFPGEMLPAGAWPGPSTPNATQALLFDEETSKWSASRAVIEASYPKPSWGYGRYPGQQEAHRVLTRDANGLRLLQILARAHITEATSTIDVGEFELADPRPMPQYWDGIGLLGGHSNVAVLFFDWKTGKLLACSGDAISSKHVITMRAQLPALSSPDTPFAWCCDFRRYVAVFVYPDGMRTVDLSTGEVRYAGPLPDGVTGFTALFWDGFHDTYVATGELGGSDHLHVWDPVPLSVSVPAHAPVQQDQWFEGLVSAQFFDNSARFAWGTKGGNWTDQTGAQDSTASPYGSAPQAPLNAWTHIACTALVGDWLASGNNVGLVLRKTGPDNSIAGRTWPEPSERPYLTVVTDQGEVSCPCIGHCAAVGDSPGLAPPSFYAGATFVTLLKFDLREIKGTLQSATLHLRTVNVYRGAATLTLYRPKMPTVKVWGSGQNPLPQAEMPRQGIAAGYIKDEGIASHPDVVYATKFPGDGSWRNDWPDCQTASHYTHYFDERLGTDALRWHHPSGSNRTPQMHEENVHLRMYGYWDEDCIVYGQGGKYWLSVDYRNHNVDGAPGVTGNGGSGNIGLKVPAETRFWKPYTVDVANNRIICDLRAVGSYPKPQEGELVKPLFHTQAPPLIEGHVYQLRNVSTSGPMSFQLAEPGGDLIVLTGPQPGKVDVAKWYLPDYNRACIWRHSIGTASEQKPVWMSGSLRWGYPSRTPRSPHEGYVVTHMYDYHAEIGLDQYGESKGMTGGPGVSQRDTWYCQELQVQLNSVLGPFDQFGNGFGQHDGIERVWINGYLESEESTVVMRHHPRIALNNAWIEFVYGGTLRPLSHYHVRIADLVIARQYIGPMGG